MTDVRYADFKKLVFTLRALESGPFRSEDFQLLKEAADAIEYLQAAVREEQMHPRIYPHDHMTCPFKIGIEKLLELYASPGRE